MKRSVHADVFALLVALCAAGLLTTGARAGQMVFNVEAAQEIQARLDMVDASSTQNVSVTGTLVADIAVSDSGGAYVSGFQATGGLLSLAGGGGVSFVLEPPTTDCLGTLPDLCAAGSGFCTETVGSVPGKSLVLADWNAVTLVPGGKAFSPATTGPGTSSFPVFDSENPSPDDNFKLTANTGTFFADGCALNQEVLESQSFGCGGCASDFWGFGGEATLAVTQEDPLVVALTLPFDHNLLVVGYSGPDADYGILNLSGQVQLVPEPGGLAGLAAGAALLAALVRRRRATP